MSTSYRVASYEPDVGNSHLSVYVLASSVNMDQISLAIITEKRYCYMS